MKTTPAPKALALLAATMTAAACSGAPEPPEADHSPSAPAPSPPADEQTGEVYVLDLDTWEGDSEELSLQRPESLTLTEFSWADSLEWRSWGESSAVATGRIAGMFCGSGCEGEEYEVTLVLCEVEDDHYRRFGVFGDFPEFDDDEWAFGGPLYISGRPEGDDDWSNGCPEPSAQG